MIRPCDERKLPHHVGSCVPSCGQALKALTQCLNRVKGVASDAHSFCPMYTSVKLVRLKWRNVNVTSALPKTTSTRQRCLCEYRQNTGLEAGNVMSSPLNDMQNIMKMCAASAYWFFVACASAAATGCHSHGSLLLESFREAQDRLWAKLAI